MACTHRKHKKKHVQEESDADSHSSSTESDSSTISFHPDMSPETLLKQGRKAQNKINEQKQSKVHDRKKLADKTNSQAWKSSQNGSSPEISETLSKFMKEVIHFSAGKFTYMHMLWLQHPEQLKDLVLDDNYNPITCYDSLNAKLQGQLRDIRDIIPENFHEEFSMKMFWTLVQNLCPILYKNYKGHHDKTKIFLNPALFQIYTVLVRGAAAAKGNSGTSGRPPLGDVWSLKATGITPGVIAARHALSVDNQLQPIGSSTNIRYQDDMEYYLKYLNKGLLTEDRHVIAIIHIWNEYFYPDLDSTIAYATGPTLEKENEDPLNDIGVEHQD
ncbi:hypothetical protein M422DRAFT_264559 [Sphaerobolus stellatus SS14]|uniref:Uncharacterized protein n=1 Tax=Sphaerobolus stellatus (strain SS14) TaxID=990650 RepID=A0A0C9V7S6_SPHS4|nr:hypothetical protein M422DRAFT_264559 [Sphaerobolus stellatus SS14]